ncbi:MAG: tetratricopeptide repeat protein [Halieaceae bacterium]|jgi:predicted Zn-dependent protease|nr:tetratricopeptide repeat protein [Halieaceae bacterium]
MQRATDSVRVLETGSESAFGRRWLNILRPLALLKQAAVALGLSLVLATTGWASATSVTTSTYKELTEIQELMSNDGMDEAFTRLKTLLTEVEEDSLDLALTLQTIGYVEMSRENFPEAIKYLKQSLATERLPQNVVYNVGYMVAQLHAALGQFEEALTFAEGWFKQVEEPKPSQTIFMANIYAQVKRYAESAPYAEQAIAASLAAGEEPRESWYQLLTADYFELKRYPEATQTLLAMVDRWPEKGSYWEQLASVYMVQDMPPKALATLKIAFDTGVLDKENTIRSMIQLCVLQGIPEHGGRLLQQAMEMELVPVEDIYLEMLAQSWIAAREYDRAVQAYEELAKRTEKGDPWMKIANIYVDATDWKPAERAAIKALDSELEEPGKAWLILGIARVEQGKFEEGRTALRKARAFSKTERSAAGWLNYAEDMKRQADWLASNSG